MFIRPSLLYQTQTVVVRDPGGVWVLDPNYFEIEISEARRKAEEVAPSGGFRRLLLTHSDFDHTIGAHAFRDFETVVSGDWDDENEKRGLAQEATIDQKFYIDRPKGAYLPSRKDRMIRDEGERLDGMVFFHAPGHTRDGLIAFHERTGVLFLGDYLSGIEFPFIYVDFGEYVRTFSKICSLIRERPVRWVVSEHGPATSDQTEVQKRIRDAAKYLKTLLETAREKRTTLGEHPLLCEAVASSAISAYRDRPVPPALTDYHRTNAKLALQATGPGDDDGRLVNHLLGALGELLLSD